MVHSLLIKNTSNFDIIPFNWNLTKIKYIAETIPGGTPSTSKNEYWENGIIPWLQSGKLKNSEVLEADKFITELGLKSSSTKMIKPNTTLVALTGATCANIGYLTFEACANQSVIAIEEDTTKVESRFLFYSMLNIRNQILINQTGGAQAGVNNHDISNLQLLLPPKETQIRIAEFLDKKTAAIDTIIEKKGALLLHLEVKKKAIINEAVTKGLNPNVPMKNSNIEWVGEIPAHWEITLNKYVTEKITDGAHISPDRSSEDFPFVSTVDIKNGIIDFENCIQTSKGNFEYLQRNGCEPVYGDILYSKDGTIGKTTTINFNKHFIVASSLIIVKPDQKRILSKYLEYIYMSEFVKHQVESSLSGVAIRRVSLEKFSNLRILLPSFEEQEYIVNSLNAKINELSKLNNDLTIQIRKLKEYRQSLISEAVTGKLEIA